MTEPGRTSTEQLCVIEDFGLAFEIHGMPRMAGRILGRLLMCDPPQQSMSQLVETLSASKGSISSMTRLLIQRKMVERVALPGDRQDYFQIRSGSVTAMFREHMRHSTGQLTLLERAMEVADDRSDEGLGRLRDAQYFLEFMRREIPAMLQRWDESRAARTHTPAGTESSLHLGAPAELPTDLDPNTKEDE